MRTFLIPPVFLAIYASALLMLTVLITPGVEEVSYSEFGCYLAGRMDLPPALRRKQSQQSPGDFEDDIEPF
jgi:hypothetical protein